MTLKNNHTSVSHKGNQLYIENSAGLMNHTGTFTKTCPQL